jgi:hypothetical protein
MLVLTRLLKLIKKLLVNLFKKSKLYFQKHFIPLFFIAYFFYNVLIHNYLFFLIKNKLKKYINKRNLLFYIKKIYNYNHSYFCNITFFKKGLRSINFFKFGSFKQSYFKLWWGNFKVKYNWLWKWRL